MHAHMYRRVEVFHNVENDFIKINNDRGKAETTVTRLRYVLHANLNNYSYAYLSVYSVAYA